jgi:hypothetical protein
MLVVTLVEGVVLVLSRGWGEVDPNSPLGHHTLWIPHGYRDSAATSSYTGRRSS